MKNKITLLICSMLLLICFMPMTNSTKIVEPFEKKDLPFDVRFDIRFTTQNNMIFPINSHWGLLPILLFDFLDIRSFSLYEIPDTPEYLYASMEVTKLQYSEYRSVYAIYWCCNGIQYVAYTNTHSLGENVSSSCGYWGEEPTDYHYTIIDGDIIEEENRLIWKIPKNFIGDPDTGTVLGNIRAASHLIYNKDCKAPIQLRLASDYVEPMPIVGFEYTYNIQI